jgi:hypothetical protein
LATNELKGKRVNNQYGVSEWRVWPNRDIEEKAKAIGLFDELNSDSPSEQFQGGDSSAVLEAEMVEVDGAYFEEAQSPVMTIIREMSQQFAEQLSKEKQLNFQLQRELEDKDRQLKLLPDFQKQAEERRLEAESKANCRYEGAGGRGCRRRGPIVPPRNRSFAYFRAPA